MTVKSINYEEIISSLFDACDLVDDRKEQLSIKRSFTTKQDIFSDVLLNRLVSFLSGNDEQLMVQLSGVLELVEEAMKNLSSSPYLLDMEKEDYNKEFQKKLIVPFSALLLFNLIENFSTNSPIYHFINLINSKLETEEKMPLDVLIRNYIKAILKNKNLTTEETTEFNEFIGKISLKSALKQKTINERVEHLITQHKTLNKKGNKDAENASKELFLLISSALQGMRLALYFRDHIDEFSYYYLSAINKSKHTKTEHWKSLNNLITEINKSIKKGKNNQQKLINMTENLSIRYHANLNDKYMSKSAHILHYLIHHRFDRENSCWFQRQNLKYKNSSPYYMLDTLIKIYDLNFDSAAMESLKIIKNSENHPNYRLTSTYTKIYICLLIKTSNSNIKNNTLTPYIYKIISTENFKEKAIPSHGMSFFNKSSIFSNDVEFFTLIDCLSEWNINLKEELDIGTEKSDEYDIDFTSKIEKSLNKIYTALGSKDLAYNEIDDESLRKAVNSTLTTNELIECTIGFIPNMSLYFSLREMAFIYSAMSHKMIIESPSICRFVSWPLNLKRKLLKAISPNEYINDEKNETTDSSK